MVQVEDGVEGAVVKRGHGVGRKATDQEVDGVVHDLHLNLKVAVVRLLEGQQHGVEEGRVITERRVLGQIVDLYL